MKVCRIITKTFFFIALALSIAIFSTVIYLDKYVDSNYKINSGDSFAIDTFVPVTAEYNGAKITQNVTRNSIGENFSVDLKVFGVIPFSTVNVEVVDELYVAVLGNPFGMKIYTNGVLVIDISSVPTQTGNKNPAEEAGIKIGDYITAVDGKTVYTNEDLAEIIRNSKGTEMVIDLVRDNKQKQIKVCAEKSKETGEYHIGVWVRDSSAGIGTLTFYSPVNDVVCGLGHGICDEDTGDLLSLNSGELVSAEILSVEKGNKGSPGELEGRFTYDTLADIELNCEIGVYGTLKDKISISNLTEVALKQEVKNGYAQILCTVKGEEPKLYSCEIEKRSSAFHSTTQNITVTITDEELIEATGGIVQGMSGSPIIQNGKLVGAVTHVLVDDPTKGYGIFAENMLETAQSVAEYNIKEAS